MFRSLGGRPTKASVVKGNSRAMAVCLLICSGCSQEDSRSGAAPSTETAASDLPQDGVPDAGEPVVLEMTGRDFRWHLRYPGPDGELHTADDVLARRHPHVPAHSKVRIELKSDDFLYTFRVDRFDKSEMAVPDMEFFVEFESSEPGRIEFYGDQFCGYAHPELSGAVVVESEREFEEWLHKTRKEQ